ncbi:uncharacterized protein E0L32_011221 [Thyridium curvatum]|uniref:Uncharacterized protein n=1 Tax=Thyridium curvatum TaxID=1093900 RepID=A0A507BQG6_9PEZI|nr:uncharacterized protein E0L32_011221 [Thyridium curvatum]TPX19060.1 hypothetical protein E0L32_011221 [Thyridium curvatum]
MATQRHIEPFDTPEHDMYVKNKARSDMSAAKEACLGIRESDWMPRPAEPSPEAFKPRSLDELQGYVPTKLEFLFKHPIRERTNEWFASLYLSLRSRAYAFADSNFGMDRVTQWPEDSPWCKGFAERFIESASRTVCSDPLVGGWDYAITDTHERRLLVMGILSKVLMDDVFDVLLFGATAAQKKILDSQDVEYLDMGGYIRSEARANEVRLMLRHRILAPEFWPEVERLALQTTKLLLPLINLQGQAAPKGPFPRLVEIYQELHNIIAEAGYLSTCMAWSPSIFQFSLPNPGQPWDLGQEHIDSTPYNTSRRLAIRHDQKTESAAGEASMESNEKSKLSADRAGEASMESSEKVELSADRAGEASMESSEKSKLSADRALKVKMVSWPLLRRYKPLGLVNYGGAQKGQDVVTLGKSDVVYYCGLNEEAKAWDAGEGEPLKKHVRSARAASWGRRAKVLFVEAILFLLFLSLFYHGPEEVQKYQELLARVMPGNWRHGDPYVRPSAPEAGFTMTRWHLPRPTYWPDTRPELKAP